MRVETVTTVGRAPKDKIFDFSSRVENLPRWAIELCKKLETRNGRHHVTSPMGELLFDIRADAATGVVDMVAGPDDEHLMIWPTRVVPMPDGTSAIVFTVPQQPQESDQAYEAALPGLRREMAQLKTPLE